MKKKKNTKILIGHTSFEQLNKKQRKHALRSLFNSLSRQRSDGWPRKYMISSYKFLRLILTRRPRFDLMDEKGNVPILPI